MNDRPDENDAPRVNHYNGPVFNGPVSQGQFAWDNENVTQNQQNNSTVAPGYEELAERVNTLLRELPRQGLADRDRQDAEEAAGEVLAAIGPDAPVEESRVRRALATLRGVLAPVATGVAAGATTGAQAWALAAIGGLTGIG
ncbi:hypothetical protein DEJ44_10395 [Streptomyces venezuelae]|uniref:hypothetical protein n=1 Tax=Streptomyces venezuelae TaxID=54571 RepID=UPI00123BD6A4|nr:hypothetical protein [Streptomyces venezuelae]QES05987.1 hypothetical protein DEJ44_10395 [Streptomyces venezuelae]